MKTLFCSFLLVVAIFATNCKGQNTTVPPNSATSTSPVPQGEVCGGGRCHLNASCVSQIDSPPRCQCNVGFSGDGTSCTDLCTTLRSCDAQASCFHTGNASNPVQCVCNNGFTGNGSSCVDVNECVPATTCPVNTTCQNTAGSFLCSCPNGYTLNGTRCVDVNECLVGFHECPQTCINVPGTFTCECRPGYVGNGLICEIDPCNETTCGVNATCELHDDSGRIINFANWTSNIRINPTCVCNPGLQGNAYAACTAATTSSPIVSSTEIPNAKATTTPSNTSSAHPATSDAPSLTNTTLPVTTTNPANYSLSNTGRTVTTNTTDILTIAQQTQTRAKTELSTMLEPTTQSTIIPLTNSTTATTKNSSITTQKNTATTTIPTTTTTATSSTTTNVETTTDPGIRNPCVGKTCAGNATCFIEVFRNGRLVDYPFYEPVLYGILPTDTIISNCRCMGSFTGDGNVYCAPTCDGSYPVYLDFLILYFPTTLAPQWSYSKELCSFTGQPLFTVQCIVSYSVEGYITFFGVPIPIPCTNESISTIVSQIPVEFLNTTELDAILTSVDALTFNTTNVNSQDISAATNFINDLAANATNLLVSEFSYQRIVNIADHVTTFFDVNNQTSGVPEAGLVQSLTSLAYQVVIPINGLLSFSSPNIVAELIEQQNPTQDIKYSPVLAVAQNSTFVPIQPVSIVIPLEALLLAEQQTSGGQARRKRATNSMDNTTVRAVFVLHQNSTLFPSSDNADWVVSGNVGNQSTPAVVTNLANPINVAHNTVNQTAGKNQNDTNLTAKYVNETCVFWNFTSQAWSTQGCCLEPNTNPPQCKCNHLTNFAILVSIYEIPPSISQQIVSIVGCSLSIASLIFTIILLLISKDIRDRRPMRVLMNICANLAVVYLIFLIGIDKRDSETGCVVSAILLHYFLLVAWCWMAVYGHLLYKSIVKIFNVSWDNYLIKTSFLSYGFPLVVIAITTAVNKAYEMQSEDSPVCGQGPPSAFAHTYLANNMCWIHGYSLYIAFLLPVACLISFNVAMFALVMRGLTCKRQKISSTSQNPSNLHNLAIALSIASTLGVVWFFGFFMMVSDNPQYLAAMSWLFTIVAAFQGFCVFVLTCIRQGDVRRLWWPPVQRVLCCQNEDYSVASSSKTADGSGPSTAQGTGLRPIKYEQNPELSFSSSKGTQT